MELEMESKMVGGLAPWTVMAPYLDLVMAQQMGSARVESSETGLVESLVPRKAQKKDSTKA